MTPNLPEDSVEGGFVGDYMSGRGGGDRVWEVEVVEVVLEGVEEHMWDGKNLLVERSGVQNSENAGQEVKS